MGDRVENLAKIRERVASELLLVLLVLGLPFALASLPRVFDDGDVSWHVALGRWIAAHGAIPALDPFSFSAAGRAWIAMEWPADLVLAGAYRIAGYSGLAAVVAAALMALNWVVFLHLRQRVGPIGLTIAIIGMSVVLAPFMLARPHVLVWPVVAGWTALLAKASETGRRPPFWTALLLTLWTNLHGSFPLAAVIAAPLCLDALIKAKWTTLGQWLLFGAASFVAICLNLNGLDGLLQPFRVAQLQSLGLIQEWMPSTTQSTPQFFGALLLVLGILLWRGVRLPIGRLMLLLAMLFLAFTQLRHQSWLAIVAAVLIPPLFESSEKSARRIAPLALATVPLILLRAILPFMPPENTANPRHLIAAIPPDLRAQPVLNGYTFGGPLILAGIKPYIDGRSELYGDDFMNDYVEMTDGDMARFNRAVGRYHIRWTILPARTKLVSALDKSDEWRRIYSDKVGVIHRRLANGP